MTCSGYAKAISQKESPSSPCRSRTDQHIPLGQLRMAFQAALDRLHGFFAQRHALLRHFAAQLHDRMEALPRPTLGPCQHGLDIDPRRPMPVQCHKTPTPFNGMVWTVIGRVRQPGDGCATLVGTLPQAVQTLWASPTACWTVLPLNLPPRQGHWRGLLPRRPPGGKRLDDASTGLRRAPKGAGQLRAVCIHHAARQVLCLQAQVVSTRPGLAPREAAAGYVPKSHGGLTIATQTCDTGRGRGCLVVFAIWAKIASGSAIWFGGLALRPVRPRPPRRLSTAAMGAGAGPCSALEPCAPKASSAAWAV